MKQHNPKVGDIVRVTFLDHCRGSGDTPPGPISLHVHGEVVRVNSLYLSIASWIEIDGTIDSNTEVFTVVRSCITNYRRLK